MRRGAEQRPRAVVEQQRTGGGHLHQAVPDLHDALEESGRHRGQHVEVGEAESKYIKIRELVLGYKNFLDCTGVQLFLVSHHTLIRWFSKRCDE